MDNERISEASEQRISRVMFWISPNENLSKPRFLAVSTANDYQLVGYGGLSGAHLSSLTHLGDTPWDTVWNKGDGKNKKCASISNELIQEFYQRKLETPSGSGH